MSPTTLPTPTAGRAAGRDPAQIELLPVTKFFPASDVALLAAQGCRSFGEARDQEARAKAKFPENFPG